MKNIIITGIWAVTFFSSTTAYSRIYECPSKDGDSVIYQSDPCPNDVKNKESTSSAFDGWTFGMHIPAMKQEVRKRELPMSPGKNAFFPTLNEKHLISKPNAREYTYKTKIMDKPTSVTLFFTKTTEELYKIKATFHVQQQKPEERKYFYESLYAQLSKKYGKAQNIQTDAAKQNAKNNPLGSLLTRSLTDNLIGTLLAWGLDSENIVTLSFKKNYHTMTSYQLTYMNKLLEQQNKKEITYTIKQQTDQAVVKDIDRL